MKFLGRSTSPTLGLGEVGRLSLGTRPNYILTNKAFPLRVIKAFPCTAVLVKCRPCLPARLLPPRHAACALEVGASRLRCARTKPAQACRNGRHGTNNSKSEGSF